MDLWIRNQSKKQIIKVNHIYIDGESIWADHNWLGDYKTEERALEVLDEIQEILYPNLFAISKDMVENGLTKSFSDAHILTRNHNEVNIYERQSCVYEMPKE